MNNFLSNTHTSKITIFLLYCLTEKKNWGASPDTAALDPALFLLLTFWYSQT